MSFNRRTFIRSASLAAAGHVAGFRPFGVMNGLAQSSPGYKALVCLFLYGGNDSNNTIVPYDTNGYANYSSIRGPLAIAQNSLLPLTGLPNYALHPNLPDIQTLFNNGTAALVANVGTLIAPMTAAEYLAGQTAPTNLFSHSDQQLEWQNAAQSGATPTGWAGRIADMMGPSYNPNGLIPVITSVYGDELFCNGASTSPVAVNPGDVQSGHCSETAAVCKSRLSTAQQLLTFASGVSLVQADVGITQNAYTYMSNLTEAMQSSSPLQTQFPANNSMAAQLQQVAQIIQARTALGVNRQIFFVGLRNFDTHANQLAVQGSLLAQISPAMSAFYAATQELGVASQVTTFTMSDFSRALEPNGNSGTDHAWGGHHIVFGGAVNGGQLYGTFPTLALGGPDDSGVTGRWVPSTSSVQYAATLASWFGVPSTSLPTIFPTIGNFTTQNLGFV